MPAFLLPTVAQGSNQPQFVLVNPAQLGNLGQQFFLPGQVRVAGLRHDVAIAVQQTFYLCFPFRFGRGKQTIL